MDTTSALVSKIKKNINRRKGMVDSMQELAQPVSEEHPLVVSFVGRFKTGKSSLINAILGTEILPTRATTATAVVTRIRKGKQARVYQLENGSRRQISIEQAKDLILNYKTNDVSRCMELLFELPIPWLSPRVEIRDTPGMFDSAQDGILEEVTMRSLQDTDMCVLVYDAQQFLDASERERTKTIREMMGGNVVYAVNRINLLSSQNNYDHVKKQAESYFTPYEGELPQMGKYYMISSAPGNLYLDGFDMWFKKMAKSADLKTKEAIRDVSLCKRLSCLSDELLDENQSDYDELEEHAASIESLHNTALAEEKRKSKKAAQNTADSFLSSIAPQAEKNLLDISALQDKLTQAKNNNAGSDYSKLTAETTIRHFTSNYRRVCNNWPGYFSYHDNTFIDNAIDNLTFPDRHYISVAASTKEKLGGAGAGAAIGFLFGGPIGAAIGGFIGGGLGGANNTEEDSISNTMQFVRETVVPALRKSFSSKTYSVSRSLANKTVAVTSGYELQLSGLGECKRLLSAEKNKLRKLQ